jgi:hypothetical protein
MENEVFETLDATQPTQSIFYRVCQTVKKRFRHFYTKYKDTGLTFEVTWKSIPNMHNFVDKKVYVSDYIPMRATFGVCTPIRCLVRAEGQQTGPPTKYLYGYIKEVEYDHHDNTCILHTTGFPDFKFKVYDIQVQEVTFHVQKSWIHNFFFSMFKKQPRLNMYHISNPVKVEFCKATKPMLTNQYQYVVTKQKDIEEEITYGS